MPNLISICVPAYKRTSFLKRLLDSILIQTFQDFEVIVTDDSPDEAVRELCVSYSRLGKLYYFRNEKNLGTPENWNESIRRASGQWIKLMHDDDWFSNPESLAAFADTVKQNPGASFIFSAFRNIYLGEDRKEPVFLNRFRYSLFKKNPATLFSSNIIGPPSVLLHRNDGKFFYDNRLKWLVDIDFYMRYLEQFQPVYIDKCLIEVGLGSEQVTRESFRVASVEIPEHFYLLEKTGIGKLRNILVYDAWWRLIRNLGIKTAGEIREAGYPNPVPIPIAGIIGFQRRLPAALLKKGVFSKFFMSLSYLGFLMSTERTGR